MQDLAGQEPSVRKRIVCFFLPLERPMAIRAPTGFINPRSEDVPWLKNAELPKPFNHSQFKSGKNFVAFTPMQAGGARRIDAKPLAFAQITAEGVAKNTPIGTRIEWPEDVDLGFGLAYTSLQMGTALIQNDVQTEEEAIDDALIRCFESLRPFELAYSMTSGDIAYPLTTMRSAASVCTYTIYDLVEKTWTEKFDITINDTDQFRYNLPEFIDGEQVALILQHTELSRIGLPFVSFDYWIREAQQSCRFLGRYDTAVVQAFTAGEVFLDSLLMMLAWEEITYNGGTLSIEDVAYLYSFQNNHGWRVNSQFSNRLRGWDRGPSPRAHEKWLGLAAKIRSKVVHTGYIPPEQEAREVIAICLELVERVKCLLASDANRTKYPRCALLLLSRTGLERFGAYKGKVKALFEAEGNGVWAEEFVRFQNEVRVLIASPPPRVPRDRSGSRGIIKAQEILVSVFRRSRNCVWRG